MKMTNIEKEKLISTVGMVFNVACIVFALDSLITRKCECSPIISSACLGLSCLAGWIGDAVKKTEENK